MASKTEGLLEIVVKLCHLVAVVDKHMLSAVHSKTRNRILPLFQYQFSEIYQWQREIQIIRLFLIPTDHYINIIL